MLSKAQISKIQSLQFKKYRKKHGLFLAEGPKTVELLLDSSDSELKLETIFALNEWITKNLTKLNIFQGQVIEITDKELNRASPLESPNQVLAMGKIPEPKKAPANVADDIILILDNIQIPGNMGNILRIADWYGINHIYCNQETVDIYNPKVVQASMGTLAHVNIYYVDLIEEMDLFGPRPLYSTVINGRNLYNSHISLPAGLIIGHESRGVSKALQDLSAHCITIPGRGAGDSLNVAVATGIVCDVFSRLR